MTHYRLFGLPTLDQFVARADLARLPLMLFMVIERFKNGDAATIGERFQRKGRMLPADVAYHASWVDAKEGRCFQIMEAPSLDALNAWIDCWEDLVEFETVPVVTSTEFWSKPRAD